MEVGQSSGFIFGRDSKMEVKRSHIVRDFVERLERELGMEM
jgi:hypothetical protein